MSRAHITRALGALVLLAPCAALVPSCREPTAFGIELTTDIPCGSVEWTRVGVGDRGTLERGPAQAQKAGCTEGYVGRLTVVPSSKGDMFEVRASLRARSAASGDAGVAGDGGAGDSECWGTTVADNCVVARRVVRFVPHHTLPLKIFLSSVCLGVACPTGQTCGPNGKCIDACQENCADDGGAPDSGVVDSGFIEAGPDASVTVPPITALWAGGDGTCSVHADNTVRCWGDDALGQLARPNGGVLASPRIVPNLNAKGALALGAGFGCMRGPNKLTSTYCFGDDAMVGRLGSLGPFAAPGNLNLVQDVSKAALGSGATIAVGGRHACASVLQNTVEAPFCWGDNAFGQLGITVGKMSPWAVPGPTLDVTALTAGNAHTCVITTQKQVMCWGKNDLGQSGPKASGATPGQVDLGNVAIEVAAGDAFTCAIDLTGLVQCWGSNATGALGVDPAILPYNATPDGVGVIAVQPTKLSAGAGHACVLDNSTADVTCWGADESGQLGNGTMLPWDMPATITGPFARVATGRAHTCVVRDDHVTVACWGANDKGQLGLGATSTPLADPYDVVWVE